MNQIPTHLSIRIVFIYAVFGVLWILLSDQLLIHLFPDPDLITRLQTFKGWIFIGLSSGLIYLIVQRGQRSLRRSNALLWQIIEGTTDAIFIKDLRGRYRLINTSGAEILGHPMAAILNRDDRAFLPPAIAQHIQATDRDIIAHEKAVVLEETVVVGDIERTYSSAKFTWRDMQGGVQGVIGIARDITEQKQLQEERLRLIADLQQQTQDLQALSMITANAISTLNLEDLLDILLSRIAGVVDADAAVVFLDANSRLSVKASVGTPLVSLGQSVIPVGQGFAGTIAANHTPLYIDDAWADPYLRQRLGNPPHSHPIALLGVPLKRQNQLIGVLQLEWHKPHLYRDREVHLLEITAERCAIAILNAQLFEQTKLLQERLQQQFDHMPLACIQYDADFRIMDWNRAAEGVFGYAKVEVLGKHPYGLIIPLSAEARIRRGFAQMVDQQDSIPSTTENYTKAGQLILCQWHHVPLQDTRGEFAGLLAMAQDVTHQQRTREQLRRSAYYDSLTGLPNRKLLLDRLQQIFQTRTQQLFAVLHVDLRRFQEIKYGLGHHIAEQLLVAAARRIESHIQPPGMLARVGADEFVVLIEQLTDRHDALNLAQRLHEELLRPFPVNGFELYTTSRIGIALSSLTIDSPEALLQAADTAMHEAKQIPDAHHVEFDRVMLSRASQKIHLETELRQAIQQQALQLYYQPILSLEEGCLVGFEALIRWPHPQGMRSPLDFIPLAEQSGLIQPLGLWVLQETCQQLRHWQQRFASRYPNLFISVNLSVAQLRQPDLLAQIDGMIQATRLHPQHLKLEITESALMHPTTQVLQFLDAIKARQLRLCIDDFGTGYSSLSYLHNFTFNSLKIDRSFVSRLETDPKSTEIIRTILALTRSLSMQGVAEGIETAQQAQTLKALGCHQGQGYWFAPPMPHAIAEQWMVEEGWKARLP